MGLVHVALRLIPFLLVVVACGSGSSQSSSPDAGRGAAPPVCVARSSSPVTPCAGSKDCPLGELCCTTYNKGIGRLDHPPACQSGPCPGFYVVQPCTDDCECATDLCRNGACADSPPASCVTREFGASASSPCRGSFQCPVGMICCGAAGDATGVCATGRCGGSTPAQLCTSSCECWAGQCDQSTDPRGLYGNCR